MADAVSWWRVCLASACLAALAAPQDRTPYPRAASKKGLQVQMVDDALALQIHHAALNCDLVALADLGEGAEGIPFRCDGVDYVFRRAVVEALDAQIAPLSRAGVTVSLILLAIRSGDARRDALLLHPRGAAAAPNRIHAFDTETPAGRARLRATVRFLAARYAPGGSRGQVWNWIVGNEVNSHWWWYNLGPAPRCDVVAAYAAAVRLVHDAVHDEVAAGRTFVSLEHHWTLRFGDDDQRAFGARDFLREFAALVRAGGDFGWHVAFHPYPENLAEPRFWLDRTAGPDADAGRVTFKNLPVLLRELDRPELQWQRQPRRVILSEQGFHCRDDATGERDQAAALAAAFWLVQQQDGIDAFLLHRHVDHRDEGGLRLGLWSRVPGTVCEPAAQRPMYRVFAACGTERFQAAAASLLPAIGCSDWAQLTPASMLAR